VFHAAGYYPTVTFDRAAALRKCVTGMRHLIGSAREAGVRRVVYTGTLSTIGVPPEGRAADERDHYLPGQVDDTYWEVKWAMEQECWRAVAEGQDVVVTNPTICFGPGDVKPTSGAILVHLAKRRLPAFMDGAWNVVDVRDVARAHIAAAEHGRTGHRYVLGGHNVTVSMFLHHAARVFHVPAPRILLPGMVVEAASIATELAAIVTRRPPLLPLEGVDMIRYGQHFDSSKARTELGLTMRPLTETLADAMAWFRAQGRI
jgi:dihydroflavonol-4-reductase